jgi:exosome complex RNA-binding protein Rrp42 (RNase PH superfamily)
MDSRTFKVISGSIPHAFGSATLTFGEKETQIMCGIKGEISRPLPSEPNKGQIRYYLESSTP